MIINEKTKEVICEGRGVCVNLNPKTNQSEPLPEKFIEEIKRILKPKEAKAVIIDRINNSI